MSKSDLVSDLVRKAAWSVIVGASFIGVSVIIGSIYVGLGEAFGPTVKLIGMGILLLAATVINLIRI